MELPPGGADQTAECSGLNPGLAEATGIFHYMCCVTLGRALNFPETKEGWCIVGLFIHSFIHSLPFLPTIFNEVFLASE